MAELSNEEIKVLIEKSYNSRTNILKMMKNGEGHIGGAFSALDIITVIYNHILKFNPEKPKWKDRDRFILSAGHKVLALYAVLADAGYFDEEILWTYNNFDTRVPMHPDEKVLPGIEFPTGIFRAWIGSCMWNFPEFKIGQKGFQGIYNAWRW